MKQLSVTYTRQIKLRGLEWLTVSATIELGDSLIEEGLDRARANVEAWINTRLKE